MAKLRDYSDESSREHAQRLMQQMGHYSSANPINPYSDRQTVGSYISGIADRARQTAPKLGGKPRPQRAVDMVNDHFKSSKLNQKNSPPSSPAIPVPGDFNGGGGVPSFLSPLLSPGSGFNLATYSKTLEDFLSDASRHTSGMYDGIESGFNAREQALRNNASLAEQAIKGLYGDVVDNLGASRDRIGESHDTSRQQILDTGAGTVEHLQNTFNQSQNTQAEIARNLGIEDAYLGLQENGNYAQQDLMHAVENAQARTQGNADLMSGSRNTQMNLNTGMTDSANLRAAEEGTLVQNDLMNYLAQLEDERATMALQREQDNMSLALQLYNEDYNRFMQGQQMEYGIFNDQRNYEMGINDRNYQRRTDDRNFQLGIDDRGYQRQWEQEQFFRGQAADERAQQQKLQAELNQGPAYKDMGSYGQFQQNVKQNLAASGIDPAMSGKVDMFIQNALRNNPNSLQSGNPARFAQAVVEQSDGSIPPELLWGLADQYFKTMYTR